MAGPTGPSATALYHGDEDASRDTRSARRDHMRNKEIRRILHISLIDEIMRCGRLRWFGHVQRRDADNVTRRVMDLAIPGTRRRGRPEKTWKQQLKHYDMTAVGVTLDMALDRTERRRRTRPTLEDREKASQCEQGEHELNAPRKMPRNEYSRAY